MKTHRFIVLFLLLALLAPAKAFAQNQSYPYSQQSIPYNNGARNIAPVPAYSSAVDPDYTDPRVRTCQASIDCVIFEPPCRPTVAVNTFALPELESWKRRTSFRYGCGVNKSNPYNVAACINGYCAMTAPQALRHGDVTNAKYCEYDGQCRVAVSPCGKKFAVNDMHYSLKQAELDAEGPCGELQAFDKRQVIDSHCNFGECTVLLDNYDGGGR